MSDNMKINCVDHIEVSSICDNKCQYCPASVQKEHREVGFMTMETFMKVIKLVDYCVNRGTQSQLNLYGIGEPTLNPHIVDMVQIARNHLPPHIPLHMNTNGNSMTHDLAQKLKEAGITSVDVTGHDAYVTAKCIKILKKYGIFGVLSVDFMLNPNTWAGQVDWFEPDYRYPCPWLKYGRVFVMWDGRITRCSLDAFALGIIGTVSDDFRELELSPFELCKKCHQDVPGGI